MVPSSSRSICPLITGSRLPMVSIAGLGANWVSQWRRRFATSVARVAISATGIGPEGAAADTFCGAEFLLLRRLPAKARQQQEGGDEGDDRNAPVGLSSCPTNLHGEIH